MNRIALLITGLSLMGYFVICHRSSTVQQEPIVPDWQARSAPPKMDSCVECHQEFVTHLSSAPHANTLLSGLDPLVLSRFTGKAYQQGSEQAEFLKREDGLYYRNSNYPEEVRVDWVFGSGSHAMTPITLYKDAQGRDCLIQLRTSWYPNNELGPTLGQKLDVQHVMGIERIGVVSDHPETKNCFGCHSNHIDHDLTSFLPDKLTPGIGCERCHPGSAGHLESLQQDHSEFRWSHSWSGLSALESVNRCGGCHRRADEMNPEELTPEEGDLPRLASVGLTLSACFQPEAMSGDPGHLNCTTCHDPHQPASREVMDYVATCIKCHCDSSPVAGVCHVEPNSKKCLECHMPKVEIAPRLKFTDHWIRIRESSVDSTSSSTN